ncbi:MAG: VIT domain-containing protein [Polyangiaceae bacterium]
MNELKGWRGLAANWQRMLLVIGGLALTAMVIVAATLKEPAPSRSAPLQARLELAAGDVRVNFGAGEQGSVSGTALVAGATVTTGHGARALVRMPNGSTVFLRGDSRVKLDRDSLELESGEYWLDTPAADRQALVHRSGDAEITAAEAGLSIRKTATGTVVYVARGSATLSAKAGRIEVHAGEEATVATGQTPHVAPLAFWDDWTGGMADFEAGREIPGAGAGSIYGVDEGLAAGTSAQRLEISRQSVHAVVRDGISETEVDQTFFNPGERAVEGWYWFTVPERASVTGFAVETDGALIEGEFIEKREAAAQYGAAKTRGHAPAILEYVDNRTYRARIYPVNAGGTRRVVLRYIELRAIVDGKVEYVYPMGRGQPVRIGEFSLSVDLGDSGSKMKIATLADARVEQGGKLVTMRRSGYTPRAPFQLEAKLDRDRQPLTLARFAAGEDNADYVLARYTPDVDWASVKEQRADVVIVVDTSAAGDEGARQLKVATAEAILRSLSEQDRFALVSLDVRPTVLHPQTALAPASDQEISSALEALSDHASGGATDLSAMFDVALERLHGAEQPAIVYVGDGLATSGELNGEQIVERLRRALGTSRARLFTVGVGSDADLALLSELADAGGGHGFRVDSSEETTSTALELTAAIKVPTITDFEMDLGAGLDEPFSNESGKVSRGNEVTVLARTHHDIPARVKVKGRFAGKPFEKEYSVEPDKSVMSAFVPRLWASEYVRRLLGQASGPDAERGRIVKLGVDYGLMTPYTSVLALESEAAYAEMGITRHRSALHGVRLSALEPALERRLWTSAPGALVPLAFGCSKEAPEQAPASVSPAVPLATVSTVPTSAPLELSPAEPAAPAAASAAPAAEAVAEVTLAQGSGADGMPRAKAVARAPSRPSNTMLDNAPKPQRHAEPAKSLAAIGKLPAAAVPTSLASSKPRQPTGVCSDSASRPLAQRVLLWRQRFRAAKQPAELLERYDTARLACELDDWQAERVFLDLLQQHIDSEGGAELVLSHFADRADVQKYIAKLILRRAVDARLVAAVERVLFGGSVDWLEADLKLQTIVNPDERLLKLRELLTRAPGDPNGSIRLIRALLDAGNKEEALSLGRQQRDDGILTPQIARELGDVLAAAGLSDEAVRTYSEVVEFDPGNADSRRLLGDIYLGHRWYEPAYRQYKTLTESAPSDALGWLRLAAAAAGAGRVDEALRLERRVAGAEGTPGPTDPRRWARLWSAARLAGLLSDAAAQPDTDERKRNMERELKELQLFSGPGRLVLLTWENLSSDLLLVARTGARDLALGDATDAAPAGLSATLLSPADAERATFVARLRNLPGPTPISLVVYDIDWDNKRFRVQKSEHELGARATQVPL